MLFSLRRKAPKDSPRRCLGLSSCYWETHTHGSQQLFALASLGKPTFAVRRVCTAEKLAPAGAKLSEHTHCPFGVFRRGLHEFTSANTCREPTGCVLGSHQRSSGTLAASFRSFLVRTRKGHVSPFQRRIKMSFSHRRENDEKSRRDGVSDSHPSAGKHIPTARKVLQCSRGSHRPPLPVREVCAAGSPRPQAQGARRVSALRHDVTERGGG